MQQPEYEQLPTGDWSAAAVAQHATDVWDEVNDTLTFAPARVRAISSDVMNHRHTTKMAVVLALDGAFGHIVDPFAELDGEL